MGYEGETSVWPTRHEELVREAANRRLARALRAEYRARRVERRLGDRMLRAATPEEVVRGDAAARPVRDPAR